MILKGTYKLIIIYGDLGYWKWGKTLKRITDITATSYILFEKTSTIQ